MGTYCVLYGGSIYKSRQTFNIRYNIPSVRGPKMNIDGFQVGRSLYDVILMGRNYERICLSLAVTYYLARLCLFFLAEFQCEQNRLLWPIYLCIPIYIYNQWPFQEPKLEVPTIYIRPSWRPMFAGISQQNMAENMVRLRTSILGSWNSLWYNGTGWLISQLATLYVSQVFWAIAHGQDGPKICFQNWDLIEPFYFFRYGLHKKW